MIIFVVAGEMCDGFVNLHPKSAPFEQTRIIKTLIFKVKGGIDHH